MPNRLADLQNLLQKDILKRGRESLRDIKTPSGIDANSRLGIYQDAYKLRLIEILGNNFPILWAFMGDETFWKMGNQYIDEHPSTHPNARWSVQNLPAYLAEDSQWKEFPILSEIAMIEQAIEDSFDALDSPLATMADLSAMDPDRIGQMKLELSPALFLIDHDTNAFEIFLAVRQENTPPAPHHIEERACTAVWRKDLTSIFRPLGPEEAMLLKEAQCSKNFAGLCEMAAVMDNAETAAARVAGYITEWLNAQMISRLTL